MSNPWAGRGGRGGARGGNNGGGNRQAQPTNGGGGGGGTRQPPTNGGGGGAYPPLAQRSQPQQQPPPNMASVTNSMASVNVSQGAGRGGGSAGTSGGGDRGSHRPAANGRTNGGTNGGEPGTRAKKPKREPKFDIVLSRDKVCGPDKPSKRGSGGEKVDLVANFFPMSRKPDWGLYNHRVDFKNLNPGGVEEERTFIKKKLLAQQRDHLGMHIFDGSNLYTVNRLHPNPMRLTSERLADNCPFELTITFVGTLMPTDVAYLQFFNIIMRKCLGLLNFIQIGRHYYDTKATIDLSNIGYQLIPGFITNIRQYEERLMMCVEITHKVLRDSTCLSLIHQCRNPQQAKETMVGSIVLTRYNNKTYRVDDITDASSVKTTFEHNGSNISLEEYYMRKYQLKVTDMRQPLLVSSPRARDLHRGDNKQILLIPEFCYPTGIAERDRSDYQKMNALSAYLQQDPNNRVRSTLEFMNRLRVSQTTQSELRSWGLNFEALDLVTIQEGRILPAETLEFASKHQRQPNGQPAAVQVKVQRADWTAEMKTDSKNVMPVAAELRGPTWIIITPAQIDVTELIQTMGRIGNGMGFKIQNPVDTMRIQDTRVSGYVSAIEQAKNTYRELKLVFTVMPQQRDTSSVYNEVKKRCLAKYGFFSQCFQAKHLDGRNRSKLMSVVTKLLVQINAKLGGEPWRTPLPFNYATMIVGFDVFHPGKGRDNGKKSYGAVVASTNRYTSRFFSTVSPHGSMEEISTMISTDIIRCVKAFMNGVQLPSAIIIYRDGVGEGQLGYVYETEVEQIRVELKKYYESVQKIAPRLLFIVCTKRGNARIMQRTGNRSYDNPLPGTIVDNTITLPERYDFFLVPQQARRGQTVSPTTFNVLHDDLKLPPAKVQQLTYQQCHAYFNWSGTVAVPAVCQYAHKLAFLTGTSMDSNKGAGDAPPVDSNLLPYLYYL